MNHPYAYLIGDLFFLAVWVALFFARKDLRREMLIMSVVGSLFAPLAFIYLPDYWYPDHIIGNSPIGIEDFLFAFVIAGIGATLYESIFGKTHALCECRKRGPRGILTIVIIASAVLIALPLFFGLNSIYSSYIAFGIIFVFIMYFRRDLLAQSLMSGALVTLLMLLFYQVWIVLYPGIIQHWWKLENISGILILGTPLEELVWGFSWGIVGGAVYEFARGVGLRKLK
ncbi:MAG: lycopene cyclase domain-containing protein [Patescibacteria group bacterium]|mgnify:CR=1 FL=1